MAKFRVKELSLIGNELKQAGDIVELPVGTLPAENLEAVDDEGKALEAEYVASNEARVKKMIEQNGTAGIADPAVFMKALIEQREKDRAEIAATREADRAELAATVATAVAEALAAAFPNGMHKPAATPPAA